MKKAELLARIEALEARVRSLEARPYIWSTPTIQPPVTSPTVWPYTSPVIVTCDAPLPGTCYAPPPTVFN